MPFLQPRSISRMLDLSMVLALFLTPLLFFTQSRDQFELPKLTFLFLLSLPFLLSEWGQRERNRPTPLSFALAALFAAEACASLPWTSLSWRTSLLGDYENFSGLSTFLLYLVWFRIFSRRVTRAGMEKLFLFNSLAAFLSALYAVGQHFGFDFVRWNPNSVNATREFASLGNPNFLSAYLAMSIPLYLTLSLRNPDPPAAGKRAGPLSLFSGLLGLALLAAGTARALQFLHLGSSTFLALALRDAGLLLLTLALLRWYFLRYWWVDLAALAVMALGLFSTASRGGFLGAVCGVGVWVFLALRDKEIGPVLRRRFSAVPRSYLLAGSASAALLLLFFGRPFLHRLAHSLLHVGESLAVSRLHIWGPALEMVKAHPFLGIGLDNFKIAFPYYSGIGFNLIDGMFVSSRMAHDEPLQMASTTGLLGLAAYLGVLAAFVLLWVRTYRVSDASRRWILIAVLASAAAYHVQNLFSFGVSSINLLWFLDLALVQRFYRQSRPEAPPGERRGFPLAGVVAAALALLFLLFQPARLAADIAFGRGDAASDLLKHPDPGTTPAALEYYSDYGISHLRRAAALCPLEVKYRLYLGLAYEERANLDGPRARDWYLQALQCYQQAIRMSPANAYYYNDEGRIDTALAKWDPKYLVEAEEAYGQAVHWAPASPFFIVNWALAGEKNGKQEESRRELQRAFHLDPAFTAKVLSQMAFQEYQAGDKKNAFGLLAEALRGNTACAEAYYCRGILYLSEHEKKKALADLLEVRKLNPDPVKNPSIRSLDRFIEQAEN